MLSSSVIGMDIDLPWVRRTTEADLAWWFELAGRLDWIWAKTYAESAPHHYVVLGRTAGLTKGDFQRAGRVIRTFGRPGKFWSYMNIYLESPDGRLKWWTMDREVADTDLINMATTDRAYGTQDAYDTRSGIFTQWDEVAAGWDLGRPRAQDDEVRRRIWEIFGDHKPTTLEIGCGTGALLDLRVLDPTRYTGLDASQAMLNGLVLKHPDVARVIPKRLEDVSAADLDGAYELVLASGVSGVVHDDVTRIATGAVVIVC